MAHRPLGPGRGAGRFAGIAAAALLVLPTAGCFVPIEKGREMEARIQRLEVHDVEQQRTLESERQAVRDRVEKVDQKIREVQQKIDELNQAARRSGADLGVTLARLQDDFARTKGDLEVAQHRLDELDKSVGALRTDTDARFAALKGQGAMDAYEARQRIAALPKPVDKGAVFALAQATEDKGDKGVAREIYDEFVRRWPTDPRAAEAGFREGDLLFGMNRYRDAMLAYGRVAEGFPRSDRAPAAMLGAAESMLRLEMKDDGISVLRQLVDKYPKSDAAAKARARLAELVPPPPKPERRPERRPEHKASEKRKPAQKPGARK